MSVIPDRLHAVRQEPGEMTEAQRSFPLPTVCEDVYHCGFHSEYSYGAASWLVRRPEGNVMVDSPRFHPGLAKRLKVATCSFFQDCNATASQSGLW